MALNMEKLVSSDNWATWSFALRTQLELKDAWKCIESVGAGSVNAVKGRYVRC